MAHVSHFDRRLVFIVVFFLKRASKYGPCFSFSMLFLLLKELLSTCPAKNQAGCIDRVVHHSHENQKFYPFKIAIN